MAKNKDDKSIKDKLKDASIKFNNDDTDEDDDNKDKDDDTKDKDDDNKDKDTINAITSGVAVKKFLKTKKTKKDKDD